MPNASPPTSAIIEWNEPKSKSSIIGSYTRKKQKEDIIGDEELANFQEVSAAEKREQLYAFNERVKQFEDKIVRDEALARAKG